MAKKNQAIPLAIGQKVEWVEWSDNRTKDSWHFYEFIDEQGYAVIIRNGTLISYDANYAVVEVRGWLTSSLCTIVRSKLHTDATALRSRIRAFLEAI